MLLAIDAGNTNIVFAVYDGQKQRGAWRIATDGRRTADEYAVWLIQLMALVKLRPIDITSAILASVVPEASFNLIRLCKVHFNCAPLVVGQPDLDLGIEARIDVPAEAGADRLVNAIGARLKYTPPLIVIDIGTATTFDIVDAEGHFAGGVIAPGPASSLTALHQVAAKLPKVDIVRPARVVGKGTVGAMQSGMFWGYVGLIEGIVDRIKVELDIPVTVIGTGGLCALFAKASDVFDHLDDDLTLLGLREIYRRNRPGG